MTPHDHPAPAMPPDAATIAEAASRWDARLRAPACSAAERAAFATWRDADPAHRAEFERLQALLSALRGGRNQLGLRELRDGALAHVSRHRRRRRWLALAAGLATMALATSWLLLPETWRNTATQQLAALSSSMLAPGASTQHYGTGVGQRSTVTLQDGSLLELNAMTRLEVAFEPHRRSVRLHQGQAIFHVAKQPRRPFVVEAGGRDIVAIGTAFDVRVDASSLRVTLIEGKVGVAPSGSALPAPVRDGGHADAADPIASTAPHAPAGRSAAADASVERVFLLAGEQFVAGLSQQRANAASGPLVRTVNVDKIIGWRDGQLFFEDQSLADAVEEMNKYSTVQIALKDPSLARLRVNGMFHAGKQHAFARALEDYFHIVAKVEGEQQIVLSRR